MLPVGSLGKALGRVMANHHFVKATPALIADTNLTDGDVRVYLAILSHADWGKLTNCYPSLQLIADTAGKRRSVVIKNIANLIEHGWLTRVQRFNAKGQATSLYGFPKQHTEAGVGAKSGLTLGAQSGHDQEPPTKHQRPQRFTKTQASIAVMALILDKAQREQSP